MGKALGLAVALVLLAARPAGAFTEPSGELVAGGEETVLRLHDLLPGYQIGDDGGCGPLGPVGEGELSGSRFAKRYMTWIFKYRPEGCDLEYEQVFAVPGLEPAPPLVEARTLNTPSEAAADSGFGLFVTLVNHYKEGRYRKTVLIPPSGVEAALYRSNDELVEGHIHKSATILFWRQGNLLAMIEAAGQDPRRNDSAALHFAQIQQERLEHPSPYTEAERDDTEVWLDDPSLKFPIYWLGRRFDPGQGLPATELDEAFTGTEGPPGQKTALWYEHFTLGTWTRRSWKRYQRSALGRLNLRSPCARRTELALTRGRAVVYFGHGRPHATFGHEHPRAGTCPHRPPKHYWAVAYVGRTVVGVELTICTLCTEDGYGRYNSLKGMKAILNGLTLRPKPAYAAAARVARASAASPPRSPPSRWDFRRPAHP
jgi:hypothetical protein